MANKNFTVKNGLEVGGQEVISSSGTITSAALGGQVLGTSASPSFANITTAGYLRGPASFVIDPAAHGDDTGTVVIAGNLQVDGTQTTINSTTMTVDDLNLTLASGAANAAAANGAGINVDIAGATNPSLVYGSSNDDWTFNKNLNVTGNIGVTGTVDGVDIAARDAILTSTTTTADAALPKAGGTMTGALTITGGSSGADLYINNTAPTLGFTDSNSFSDVSDIYIVRGTSTGKLQFQFFDDSANTTTQTFLIDQTGNAIFEGTVTAGAGQFSGVSGTTLVKAIGADSNGNADVEIFSTGTTGSSRLFFSDTAAQSGSITYSHNTNLMTASSAGGIKLDAAGGFAIDADGGQVSFSDGGTLKSLIDFTGNNVEIQSRVTDADLLFRGQDGASFITALTLDMSEAGAATFNTDVTSGGQITSTRGSDTGTYGFRHEGAGKYMRMGVPNASFAYFETDANAGFSFEGNVTVPNQILHAGDTDTYMQFHAVNEWRVVAGGYERFAIGPHVVVNEDSHDSDFRVESNGNDNMLFVDGGLDQVSIGANIPERGVLNIKAPSGSGNKANILLRQESYGPGAFTPQYSYKTGWVDSTGNGTLLTIPFFARSYNQTGYFKITVMGSQYNLSNRATVGVAEFALNLAYPSNIQPLELSGTGNYASVAGNTSGQLLITFSTSYNASTFDGLFYNIEFYAQQGDSGNIDYANITLT